jgi:hypothetical protein
MRHCATWSERVRAQEGPTTSAAPTEQIPAVVRSRSAKRDEEMGGRSTWRGYEPRGSSTPTTRHDGGLPRRGRPRGGANRIGSAVRWRSRVEASRAWPAHADAVLEVPRQMRPLSRRTSHRCGDEARYPAEAAVRQVSHVMQPVRSCLSLRNMAEFLRTRDNLS